MNISAEIQGEMKEECGSCKVHALVAPVVAILNQIRGQSCTMPPQCTIYAVGGRHILSA